MKFYKIQVTTEEAPYKRMEFVSAEDELEAIDKVAENYKNKNILDIKAV